MAYAKEKAWKKRCMGINALLRRGEENENTLLRLVMETSTGEMVRVDQPLSFATRRFTQRRVTTAWVAANTLSCRKGGSNVSLSAYP